MADQSHTANTKGDTKPQLPPQPLVFSEAEDLLKSPFETARQDGQSGRNVTNIHDDGTGDGTGGGAENDGNTTPSLGKATLSQGLSTSSSFRIPRSVSRVDSRLAAPLELALSGLERPDGAREARILLPGVDLRHHFGFEDDKEQGDTFEGDEGNHDGLTVLQTPKGVSLKEAVWEAVALQKFPGSHSRTSSRPSSSASAAPLTTAAGTASTTTGGREVGPSPWGALVSNLAEGKAGTPTGLARPPAAERSAVPPPPPPGTSTEMDSSSRPESAAEYITPPTIPALPEAPLHTHSDVVSTSTDKTTPAAGATTIGRAASFHNNLRIDVSYTPSLPALPSPTAGTSGLPGGIPLSPAPMLTPGAPPSVPVELRAAAAERLWPLLAPFAPHMLRDDILAPPNERRFVRAVKNSTKLTTPGTQSATATANELSTSTMHPLLPHDDCASLDLDNNQNAYAQPHTHGKHPGIPSSWRLDTEMKAESRSFRAAIAIADVSGFTSLTEALTKTGPGGVELLTRCMNSYFAQVIDLVTLHGGDVSKFAGDAMLIVFAPTREEIETATAAAAASGGDDDGGLTAATRRAAVASKELVDKFGVMSMLSTGETIAVPRHQVVRLGSKFVRQPSTVVSSDGIPTRGESGLLRRGASVGLQTAASFRKAAKTGQKVAKTAASVGSAPLAAGSRAIGAPFKMIHRLNYPDLPRNTISTSNGVGGGISGGGDGGGRKTGASRSTERKKRGGGEEQEELWMDWLEDGSAGGDGALAGVTTTTITKTRSASDILDLAKETEAATTSKPHIPLLAEKEKQENAELDGNAPPVVSAAEQALVIRAIHEKTLTALAEAFIGGSLMKVRPPALPDRPLNEEEIGIAPSPLEQTTGATAAAGMAANAYRNEHGQPPRPNSAPGTIYTDLEQHDSFIDRQNAVENNIDNLSLPMRMPSDATSVVTATASMTSNASSMALRNRNHSFGSFSSVGGNLDLVKGIATRLPSVSEKESVDRVDHSGGGSEGAWPSSVRKMVARAFRFGQSTDEFNRPDSRTSSLYPTRFDSIEGSASAAAAVHRQGSTYSSMYSAPSRDGGGISSLSLSKRNLKQRILHPSASWSAPTSPQATPPASPRGLQSDATGFEIPGPSQSSFSFGAGGVGYREYSTLSNTDRDGTVLPLTGQDSAPITYVTGGLPDDLLSLKVTVAAGTLCAYRVGGVMEPTTEGCPEAARWEFFVADADNDDEDEERKEENGDDTEETRGPITQLKETECHAVSGNVVVSKEVVDLLGNDVELVTFPDGAAELKSIQGENEASARVRTKPGLNSQIMTECIRLSSLSPQERVDAYQILRSHVPFNVRSRVESGHIDSVNEVRVCTVVFLGFPSLGAHKSGGPAESLAAMQTVTQAAQGRMHQDGGFFLQMRCDEKGYLALCAFGLPGRAHEDSPSRGVQAALAVVSNLQRQGYAAVAGVTTGNLFCGVVGSSRRAEYTVFGDAINFAARLMVRASKNSELGPVLCDEPTRWMAAIVADYIALEPIPVKGRAQPMRSFKVSARDQWTVTGMADAVFDASPVLPRFKQAARKEQDRQVYQQQQENEHQEQQQQGKPATGGENGNEKPPTLLLNSSTEEVKNQTEKSTKEKSASPAAALSHPTPKPPMFNDRGEFHNLFRPTNSLGTLVGREKELATAGSRLADLVDGRGGGAIFVEGGAGLGKSRLIEEIAWGEGLAPLRQRCVVIASAGRAMRQSEPLNPWRRVFRMIFNADVERSAERRALAGEQGQVLSSLDRRAGSGQMKSNENGVIATDLAIRLALHVPDYAVWRPVIASALGLRVEELPVALAGASQWICAARQGGLVAVDDVSVLLKARAHTFVHATGWNHVPEETIDVVLGNDATPGTTKEESENISLKRPDSKSSVGDAGQRIKYSGMSVSARNLDPGRPSSSMSNDSGALLSDRGQSSGAGGGGGSGNVGRRTALPPAEMSPQLRALKMRGLLVALLREFVATHAPLFIVFDDVHLFDGPSWRLLLAVLAACPKEVLFLCTLRPVLPLPSAQQTPSLPLGLDAPRHSSARQPLPTPGEMPTTPIGPSGLPSNAAPGGISPDEVFSRKLGEYYEEALWRDGSERIALKNFSLEETSRFISEALDGLDVPWAAAQLLYDKSAGMPAYLHQMCLFFKLRAQEIARGVPASGTATSIMSNAAVAAAAGIPSSIMSQDASMVEVARVGMDFVRATVNVHSIVPARVDRLRPDEQLTLKVASVMGATVYTDLLQAAHPKNPSMRRLEANLEALAAAGFLTKQTDPSGGSAVGAGACGIRIEGRSRDSLFDSNARKSNSTWQFSDILARDVVWDMIPLTQRREWHARLATAMARFGNTARGGGGGAGYNPHSGRRPIPPAIIAYHWSQAAVGVETTEWHATLQAIDWWERAASVASLTCAFDEEISLLHNATIMANALVQPPPSGSFKARPDLVATWRRARWDRCVAAAFLAELGEKDEEDEIEATQAHTLPGSTASKGPAALRIQGVPLTVVAGSGDQNKSDCQKAALVHCLRALHLLQVPMPWSEEYQKASKRALEVEKASKIGKFIKNIARKVGKISLKRRKDNQNDAAFGTLPDAMGLVRAALAGDFLTIAKLEPENDNGFVTEQAEPLVDVALLAAVVTSSPDWQQNISNFRFVLWVCEYLAGGPHRIQHGSALYLVKEHVRQALRRAKGYGGSGLSSREGGEEKVNGGDSGGGDGDGGGQQLRSLKEMFSLQRIHGRAMK